MRSAACSMRSIATAISRHLAIHVADPVADAP